MYVELLFHFGLDCGLVSHRWGRKLVYRRQNKFKNCFHKILRVATITNNVVFLRCSGIQTNKQKPSNFSVADLGEGIGNAMLYCSLVII